MSTKWSALPVVTTVAGTDFTCFAASGVSSQITATNLINALMPLAALGAGKIFVGSAGNLAAPVTMSGDATLSALGVLTLANSGVAASTYKSVTVDAKGRITAGTNPTTLAGYGITDALGSTLASANIYVGNGSNVATAVAPSGHISMTNAGVMTLVTTATPQLLRLGLGQAADATIPLIITAPSTAAAMTAVSSGNVGFGASISLNSTSFTGGRNWIIYSGSTNDGAGAGGFGIFDVTAAVDRLRISTAGVITCLGSNFASARTALGTTPSDGLAVTNSTAAAAGAQQYSPSIHWTGQGWKTNATAGSQPVEFRAYAVPVQGAANPTAIWTLESNINSAGFTNAFRVDSLGQVGILSTPTNSALTITKNQTDFTNTNGDNSHILCSNPNASGNVVYSNFINGALRSKIRADFLGNLVCVNVTAGGGFYWFSGGDSTVGTEHMTLDIVDPGILNVLNGFAVGGVTGVDGTATGANTLTVQGGIITNIA